MVFILGPIEREDDFSKAEEEIRRGGGIPINPVKVLYALPEEITNADFAVIAFELIRISSEVYLMDGWEKDLVATLEKNNADKMEKTYWSRKK